MCFKNKEICQAREKQKVRDVSRGGGGGGSPEEQDKIDL